MRQVELGRDKITRLILERVSHVVPDYGIELVDVQIQRINYIESVQAKVFDRMISERKRIADRHRSEGQGKSAEVRGKKERELKVIESEAYRKTQEIMGRGDAEATSIYADAYNRNRNSTVSSRRWRPTTARSTRTVGSSCPPVRMHSATCSPRARSGVRARLRFPSDDAQGGARSLFRVGCCAHRHRG